MQFMPEHGDRPTAIPIPIPIPIPVPVFVVHSQRLVGREQGIRRVKSVLESSPAIATGLEVVCDTEAESLNSAQKVRAVADVSPVNIPEPFAKFSGTMHVNQLSNALNHYAALHRAVTVLEKNGNENAYALVLEDDVLYNEETVSECLYRTLTALTALTASTDGKPSGSRPDIVFLGLPSTIRLPPDEDGSTTTPRFQSTTEVFKILPSCDSYLVNKGAAATLCAEFLPVRFPTNVHLSYLITTLRLRAEVVSPNIFLDGSKLGAFTSSLNANNRLSWNPAYNKMFTLMHQHASSSAAEQTERDVIIENAVEEVYKGMHFKNHPDVLFLYATMHIRRGRPQQAMQFMHEAYKTYVVNGCLLNRGSDFLNTYCDLFAQVQEESLAP